MAKTKFGPAPFTGKAPDAEHRPSLRELDEADEILQGFLVETEGEVTPEIEGLEAWLNENVTAAILRWGLWLRDRWAEVEWLEGQAAPFKTEYDRIRGRGKALQSKLEWSESQLLRVMRARSIPFIKSPLISVKRQDNPPYAAKNGEPLQEDAVAYEVLEKLFDHEATRHLVVYTPATFALDKTAVKQAAAAGTLPESLTALGVGVARGERIVIS